MNYVSVPITRILARLKQDRREKLFANGEINHARVYMKALILSAGQGRRLLPLTKDRPKALLTIAGKTILERQLDVLLAAGIDEVIIITGFSAHMIDQLISKNYSTYPGIKCIYNPFYDITDNLVSCWISREEMNGDFLLINGDTVFEPGLLSVVLNSDPSQVVVCTDVKDMYDDDDMKVQTDGVRVLNISKTVHRDKIDAESIGLLYFRNEGVARFRRAVEEALRDPQSLRRWFLSVIDELADEEVVNICPISGYKWCEIDYTEDLDKAVSVFEDGSGKDRGTNTELEDLEGIRHASG